jgi:purine nucleoside phosphorylase
MSETITLEDIDRLVDIIRSHTKHQPKIGIILGSGFGSLLIWWRTQTLSPIRSYHPGQCPRFKDTRVD